MKRILFLVMAMCVSTICQGQSSFHYYLKAGDIIARNHYITDVSIKGQKVQTGSIEVTEMVDRVKTNGEVQFNNSRQSLFDQFEPYIYNSSLSNSNMDVYRMKWNKHILSNGWMVPEEVGYYYVAISKDKRRMVTWKEAHGSNEIIDKQEYIEVSIDDVINGLNPKPSSNINRDFLYE